MAKEMKQKDALMLVSVANVQVYDTDTGDLWIDGRTKLDTSLSQAIQSSAIYAGKGSKKIFEYKYQKELTASITDAAFNPTILAMQAGTSILRQLTDYYKSEFVTLDASGKGTLTDTPVGNVRIQTENGSFVQVVPNGKEFTYTALADYEVRVIYVKQEMADVITINAESFPKTFELVMNVDLMYTGRKAGELQIRIPKFSPDGAMELSLSHDSVASTPLNGSCLVDAKDNLAYYSIHYFDDGDITYNDIMVAPNTIEFSVADVGDTQTLSIKGDRGGAHGIEPIVNSECSFKSSDETVATVTADGVVSLATGAAAGKSAIITITHGTAEDIVQVTATA